MTAKFNSININDIILRHASGATCKQLAREIGVKQETLARWLNTRGISTARKKEVIDIEKATELFNKGIGVAGVAKILGKGRGVVDRIFREQGIATRNRSEQQLARMANSTPEQIAQLVKNANSASRGRISSRETLEKIALTKELRNSCLKSENESILAGMLKLRGIETTPQKAIGIYNCDLAAFPVAVEVAGGGWHWYGAHLARTEKRFNEIMNSGWHVLIVAVSASSPLTESVADYVAAYIESARANPSAAREYRVIWRGGEFSTGGGINDDNFSIKPPFANTRDIISGRYKTVAR